MGFWDAWSTVKEWGNSLWNNEYIKKTAVDRFRSSYSVLENLAKEIDAAPKVLYSAVVDPQTHKVASHVARILVEDLPLIMAPSYANTLIQQSGYSYLNNESDVPWLSIDTSIIMALGLLDWSVWVYTNRHRVQMTMRMLVVLLEAGDDLTLHKPKMTICSEEACTDARFLKGVIRSTIKYSTTKQLVKLIGYIPVIGEPLTSLALAYNEGSYIVSTIIPEVCDRHQEEYFNEYAGLIFALGIGHALTAKGAAFLIEYLTTKYLIALPKFYYEEAFSSALLVLFFSIAAHMKLPPPVPQSTYSIRDPIIAARRAIGVVFEILFAGSRIVLPRIVNKERLPTISLAQVGKIWKWGEAIWFHRWTDKARFILLPHSLQSMQYFIDDPVIAPNWNGVRNKLVKEIKTFTEKRESWLIFFAGQLPGASSTAANAFFGVPEPLTAFLLRLMGNEDFMLALGTYGEKLEGLHVGPPPPIPVEEDSPSLRGHEKQDGPKVPLQNPESTANNPHKIAPETVIRHEKSTKLEAQNVIRKRSNHPKISASAVIGRGGSRFFKTDPTSVIGAGGSGDSMDQVYTGEPPSNQYT
ncbi:hypothetical protein [Legionella donaldsonii]|uniref:hypothetical protein n=1 Tax=Legionella donaldsonii TaxID=45060 RepID=UPI00399CBB74